MAHSGFIFLNIADTAGINKKNKLAIFHDVAMQMKYQISTVSNFTMVYLKQQIKILIYLCIVHLFGTHIVYVDSRKTLKASVWV